jgi:integrative and conjugative element protein (TIGR02256 family)
MNTNQENEFLEFWSNDRCFGLKISLLNINRMILTCVSSYPNETGGVLIGYYNDTLNCATITEIIFEIPDSKRGKTWFLRGIKGIQNRLHQLWSSRRIYYLGEWHFHPGGTPVPSQVDINQMLEIASTFSAHCPEPILLLFSGINFSNTITFKPYIFSKRQTSELLR